MLHRDSAALHGDLDCMGALGNAAVTTDQRGIARSASHCDAGAVQDTLFFDAFED